MQTGELWGYQHHAGENLALVRVESIGTKRPARVKVAFLDDEREGAVDWVPPARLKALWAARASYEQREADWIALRRRGGQMSAASFEATARIFEWFGRDLGAFRVHSQKEGRNRVTGVTDWQTLGFSTGLTAIDLTSGSVVAEGGIEYFPWPVGEIIAKRFIVQNTTRVLDAVHAESEQWSRGRHFFHGRPWHDDFNRSNLAQWEMTRDRIYAWAGRSESMTSDRLSIVEGLLADARQQMLKTIVTLISRNQSDLAWEMYVWIHQDADKREWKRTLQLERWERKGSAGMSGAPNQELVAEHQRLTLALRLRQMSAAEIWKAR